MGHSVRLLGVVVLALGLPGGCVKDVGIGGREQLAACYAAYERGDDGAAIEKANEFLRDNSPSVRDDEAHYLRGMAESRRGRPGEAREAFTKAAASRRPTVRAHALLALGDLAVAAGDLGSGETFYRRSLSEGTMAATPAQQAYIRLGRILQRQGQWAEADIVFSRAMHYFGHTQEGKWAATRIHGRAWTIQAGAYAQEANARAAMVPLIKAKLPARTEDVNPSPPGHRRTVTRNQISYQSTAQGRRMKSEHAVCHQKSSGKESRRDIPRMDRPRGKLRAGLGRRS